MRHLPSRERERERETSRVSVGTAHRIRSVRRIHWAPWSSGTIHASRARPREREGSRKRRDIVRNVASATITRRRTGGRSDANSRTNARSRRKQHAQLSRFPRRRVPSRTTDRSSGHSGGKTDDAGARGSLTRADVYVATRATLTSSWRTRDTRNGHLEATRTLRVYAFPLDLPLRARARAHEREEERGRERKRERGAPPLLDD